MQNEKTQDLHQEAIKAAISNNWPKAVELNSQILLDTPEDIPTLNRLGISLSMSGKNKDSVKTFEKVLEIDSHNHIAKNNLARLKIIKKSGSTSPFMMKSFSFIEEPGKSKVIPLVNQGEPLIFSSLNIGEEVDIASSKHKIKVVTKDNKFIGYFPDNISKRLIELVNAGYKYRCVMKSVNPKSPWVFVQETHSSKRLKGAPSFPLDEIDRLPSLSAGDSSEIPPLEIFDPMAGDEN